VTDSAPILIVEDSAEDFETTLRSFKKSGIKNPIFHCETGDEALDFLNHRGSYADATKAPRPGIILLDLNMPGTDGREILKFIKTEKATRTIPVVVLTTSNDNTDVRRCYEDGANSYIQKPVNLEKLVQAIACLKKYWFEIVILPEN